MLEFGMIFFRPGLFSIFSIIGPFQEGKVRAFRSATTRLLATVRWDLICLFSKLFLPERRDKKKFSNRGNSLVGCNLLEI